jgi:two-component system, cell cycle sensor histidine kinase and response regulator CckA
MKIPQSRTEAPSVQAAMGRTGMYYRIDYRGVAVLSDLRTIPETDWILLTKMDKKEIYSNLTKTAVITALICILIITAIGLLFFGIYFRKQQNIYLELYSKEKELHNEQRKFKVTMDNLGTGIIATDASGKIEYLNVYAGELLGMDISGAIGAGIDSVFNVMVENAGRSILPPASYKVSTGNRLLVFLQ